MRRTGRWGVGTRDAQNKGTACSRGHQHREAAVWGAGPRLGARHHKFHMWAPYAISFKKHNFQNVSGPQEYVVEVPPLIQPERLHGRKHSPGHAM